MSITEIRKQRTHKNLSYRFGSILIAEQASTSLNAGQNWLSTALRAPVQGTTEQRVGVKTRSLRAAAPRLGLREHRALESTILLS